MCGVGVSRQSTNLCMFVCESHGLHTPPQQHHRCGEPPCCAVLVLTVQATDPGVETRVYWPQVSRTAWIVCTYMRPL